jgi:hypothetical protein
LLVEYSEKLEVVYRWMRLAGCTSMGLFSLPSSRVYLVLTLELQAKLGK